MKPALFLILFLFFSIFIILSSCPLISLSSAHSVSVSATVDEHLTYFKDGDELIISTNSHAQYLVLSPSGDLIGQILGPTNQTSITLPAQNFILIAQP